MGSTVIGTGNLGAGAVGTWSFTSYSQTAGGTLEFDIPNTSTYDHMNLSGVTTLGGDRVIHVSDAFLNTPPLYTAFDLIHATGGESGYNNPSERSTLLTTLPEYWNILHEQNDMVLEMTPEPAPYLLIGGAIIALRLIRRRRVARQAEVWHSVSLTGLGCVRAPQACFVLALPVIRKPSQILMVESVGTNSIRIR